MGSYLKDVKISPSIRQSIHSQFKRSTAIFNACWSMIRRTADDGYTSEWCTAGGVNEIRMWRYGPYRMVRSSVVILKIHVIFLLTYQKLIKRWRMILLRKSNNFTMQATNSRQQSCNIDNQIQAATISNKLLLYIALSQFEVLFLNNNYSCKFMYSFACVHELVCNSCSNLM